LQQFLKSLVSSQLRHWLARLILQSHWADIASTVPIWFPN
jgi:hypothetical protein